MSNVTVWGRRAPFAELDGFIKDVFGPAAAHDWGTGFRPAAEIAKDGDDAVVRLLPDHRLDDPEGGQVVGAGGADSGVCRGRRHHRPRKTGERRSVKAR